jgi:hypothetical protein
VLNISNNMMNTQKWFIKVMNNTNIRTTNRTTNRTTYYEHPATLQQLSAATKVKHNKKQV